MLPAMRKLWGGAFAEEPDELVVRFGQSIQTDLRYWQEDLIGSVAHARMLGDTGIIPESESKQLVDALERIHEEGPEHLPTDVEDIHTAIEIRLEELLGDLAGKLHTARSRNDQVATDTRLHLHNELIRVGDLIKALQKTILDLARKHKATVMPGYTHMQPAQPVTLGFHLLAYFFALQRHGWRARQVFELSAYSPLGSAALAGTSFPIDRHQTAKELGFFGPMPNALDATSDRSYVLDSLHVSALIMIELSRLCQDLILWSTAEYGFVRLSDGVTTGSSIMPQKRNPDMAELIRGRSGRAIGNWTAFASTMKALPLGYNRDTQDDKPAMFESLDLVKDSLRLCSLMLESAEFDRKRMFEAAGVGFTTATDVADALVREGIPFRKAHEIVGNMVREGGNPAPAVVGAKAKKGNLGIDVRQSAASRESYGGPGRTAMGEQLRHAGRLLAKPGFPKAV